MIALRGCDASYTITPGGGALAENTDVTIVITGIREVRIHLELRTTDPANASILIDATATNDEGKGVLFTLKNMDKICSEIVNQGERATFALSDLRAELAGRKAWINSSAVKPLAGVRAARARVDVLDDLIREQEAVVQMLTADLGVAESLRAFAELLHEKASIEIAVAE